MILYRLAGPAAALRNITGYQPRPMHDGHIMYTAAMITRMTMIPITILFMLYSWLDPLIFSRAPLTGLFRHETAILRLAREKASLIAKR
jgi:hypothetical protein